MLLYAGLFFTYGNTPLRIDMKTKKHRKAKTYSRNYKQQLFFFHLKNQH